MCEEKEYRISKLQEAYLDDEGRGAAYPDFRTEERGKRLHNRRLEQKKGEDK